MFGRSQNEGPGELPGTIGSYRVVRKLGEGGMGIVYEAVDERLRRSVAIKMIRDASADPAQRDRLWREARTAAGIGHPGICQVYEIGEAEGQLFIAMEYLDGRPLADRIAGSPVPLAEALGYAQEMLAALGALHERGIVHRDLKPANIFLTRHGLKLLDFGLARGEMAEQGRADPQITETGAVVGTPHYMPPEQWAQGPLSPACDIFALGAILYEMLTAKRAFGGTTVMEVCRAIIKEDVTPLAGGPEVMAVGRVIQRSLAKAASDRFQSAAEMASALEYSQSQLATSQEAPVRQVTRLIVLPFRLLRADEEIDFLSVSLPDAVTTSLAMVDSLVIHSSAAAVKYSGARLDLEAIHREVGVDVVVSGTLLRAGDQVRLSCQLLAVPSGKVLCSRNSQFSMGDIFQLQDDLAREIVESLSLPLGVGLDTPLQKDVPRDARVYETYLRANQLGQSLRLLDEARQLYLSCLDEDPDYAPAWARLGRIYRVMAKYGSGDQEENYQLAEGAFERALSLNPNLTLAHNLYTNLEVERGRAESTLARLLDRVRSHGNNAELFAGLVVACRFCGLLYASIAADRIARHLDPGIRTSVSYTHWLMGEYERAMLSDEDDVRWVSGYSLPMLGRNEEVVALLREMERSLPDGALRATISGQLAGIEGDRAAALAAVRISDDSGFKDPEGIYFQARSLVKVGEGKAGLAKLRYAVEQGFCCPSAMERDHWLDAQRESSEFQAILTLARNRHNEAASTFLRHGGAQILGTGTE